MDLECQHNHAHMVHGLKMHVICTGVFSFGTTNVDDSCVLKRALIPSHNVTIDPRHSFGFDEKIFHMVAELVIWNNDVFNGEFPESSREREAHEIPRRNTIISTTDAVD